MTTRHESLSPQKPQMARYTLDDELIKDAHYFSRNEFSWNNRALLSPKLYPFYYKQKDLKKAHVESLKEKDIQHKKLIEDMRKKNLLQLRHEDLTRHAKHVRQRVVLERQCNQAPSHGDHVVSDDEDITREHGDNVSRLVNSFKPARSRDISWNFLENSSPKQVKHYLHQTVVKGEEHMFKVIQNKISQEENEKQLKKEKKEQFRTRMRQNLHERHETTFQTESKLNTYSLRKLKSLPGIETEAGTILNLSPTSINRDEEFLTFSMEVSNSSPTNGLKLKFASSLPRIDRKSYQSVGSGSQIIQLISPKSNDIQKVLETAHGDLKGSLFTNMERAIYNSTNPLHQALTAKSNVFKDVLSEHLREKSPTSMYTTSLMKFDNVSLRSNDRSNRSNILTKEPWRKPSFRSRKTVSPNPKSSQESKETIDQIKSFESIFDAAVKTKAQGNNTLADADRICQELGVPGVKEFRRKQRE